MLTIHSQIIFLDDLLFTDIQLTSSIPIRILVEAKKKFNSEPESAKR